MSSFYRDSVKAGLLSRQKPWLLELFGVFCWLNVAFGTVLPNQPDDVPQLSISPRGTQVKTVDSSIMFTCTLSGYEIDSLEDLVDIFWIGPGLVRISSTRGRMYVERSDEFNVRLYISKITESDAGVYTCNAELPDRTGAKGTDQHQLLTADTRLFLYEDISFADTPQVERHLAGGSALLQCIATGQPTPEMSWRFNRRRIMTGSDKYHLDERGLRIDRLDSADNGTYECRAEVASHGNVKVRLVQLDVLYPPTIIERPTAERVVKGQDTTLHCRADGNPPVNYEWFKERRISTMVKVKVRLAQGNNTYTIHDVKEDDEGRYFCRVTNTVGNREAHVDVRMLIPAEIHSVPQHVVKAEGSTLTLPCEATGLPAPRIVWGRTDGSENYTGDPLLSELAKLGILKVETDSSGSVSNLIIRDVRRSYAGSFSCTARNVAGHDVRSVSLVVEYPPTLTITETEQLGWTGVSLNITCLASGLPVPSMNWFRGEQYLSDSDTYSIVTTRAADTVTSVLTITILEGRSWVYGTYSCIAKNVHGYVTETAVINEAFPPDIPRNVTILEETPTSVRLSAVAPLKTGGQPVTYWQIQYDNGMTENVIQRFNFSDVITVSGLMSDSTYTFSLSAGNLVGVGPSVKFRVLIPAEKKVLPTARVRDHQQQQFDVAQLSDSHHVAPYNTRRDPTITSRQADDDDNLWIGEKMGQSLNEVKVSRDRQSTDDKVILSKSMVIVVGSAGSVVTVAFVVLLAVCGLRRRRRYHGSSALKADRQDGYRSKVAGGNCTPTSYALVRTSSDRQHSPPLNASLQAETDIDDVMKAETIQMTRSPCVTRTDSKQYRAWNTMLNTSRDLPDREITEIDCVSDDEVRNVMFSADCARYSPFPLPPPPPLPAASTLSPSLGRGGRTGRGRQVNEGLYCSGDAVDDVIERIDYGTISGQHRSPQPITYVHKLDR